MKLEDLVKDGWLDKGNFAGYQILGKENERLLYDPTKQTVHLRYELNKPEVSKLVSTE